MQDGNADFTIRVDIRVIKWATKLEISEMSVKDYIMGFSIVFTWRRVRVIFGKRHLGFEVASIVKRVWVDDYEGYVPSHDVIFVELERVPH